MARTMTDSRAALHKLVEKWRLEVHGQYGLIAMGNSADAYVDRCADELAAIISQPEPQDRQLGRRFVVRGSEIVKMSNGEVLPHEEPLFLIRARDWLAIPMLRKYRELAVADGCNDYLLELFDQSIADFEAFARDYPERMKQPGVTRGK